MDSDNAAISWRKLGLDPATATERDVKHAYARLLRECRPELAPVAFQQLHTAYLQALDLLAARESMTASSSEEPPAAAAPEAASLLLPMRPPAPRWPAQMSVAFQEACALLEQGALRDDVATSTTAVNALRPLIRDDPTLRQPWGQLLAWCFFEKETTLLLVLPAVAALRLIQRQQAIPATRLIRSWHLAGDTITLEDLANLLLFNEDGLFQTNQALCMARVSAAIAFTNYRLSQTLLHVAFALLPPGAARDQTMDEVDQRIAAAKVLQGLPREQLRFWECVIFQSPTADAMQWETAESTRAIDFLVASVPADWPGFAYLPTILPSDIWGPLDAKIFHRK